MRQHTLSLLRRLFLPELILTLLFLSSFAALSARGQGITTGGINGTVVDPAGAVLSGASIIAVNKSTGEKYTQTARKRRIQLPGNAPGLLHGNHLGDGL